MIIQYSPKFHKKIYRFHFRHKSLNFEYFFSFILLTQPENAVYIYWMKTFMGFLYKIEAKLIKFEKRNYKFYLET